MKNWKHWAFVAVIAIVGIIMGFAACDNDNGKNDPILCKCPNGTLHLVGETCCEGTDCKCEKNVVGQRVEGIPVTSRGGDHTKAIANVTEAFGWLTEEELTIIKDYVRDIQVRSGNGMGAGAENFSKQDGKYIIKIEELSISEGIYYALWDVTEEVSGN